MLRLSNKGEESDVWNIAPSQLRVTVFLALAAPALTNHVSHIGIVVAKE